MYLSEARRRVEESLLDRFFPAFVLHQTTALGTLTTNSSRQYYVAVELQQFPLGPPDVKVVGPRLVDSQRRPLGERGPSGAMHHLGCDPTGSLRLCLFSQLQHSPQNTLYKALLKARLWLEAYENHLRTGQPIDQLLAHSPTSSD